MELHLTLRNAEGIIYQGLIKAVSSFNDDGAFDILQGHAQIITIVKNKIIIHHLNGQKEEYDVDRGIIKVENDTILVFLGIDLI